MTKPEPKRVISKKRQKRIEVQMKIEAEELKTSCDRLRFVENVKIEKLSVETVNIHIHLGDTDTDKDK